MRTLHNATQDGVLIGDAYSYSALNQIRYT